ncbi:hypothetical protein G5I_14743 [Acromyrmex echinatior]|uniref:Uncharacterized protein n=1 Tax=Acromyrmex echinatior TaxID=103372 RepID=F4X8K4_ACREC|nr:hypothetical protein G5I_14743 [Acromyrmex echinatior]
MVARNNHPEDKALCDRTAISQGMNTEIDSANAMMVERKATSSLNREFRCRNLTNGRVLNRNNHPANRLLSLSLVDGVVNLTNIPETQTTKRRNESQIAVWHPAQFKTFSRMARGTGDEERNMGVEGVEGIWYVTALVTYIRWPLQKLAPLLSPEKPNCRKSRRRLSRDLRAGDIAVLSSPSARFYRFIRFASSHDERNLATKKNLTNDGCLSRSTRGHYGRFMGFKCTSLRSLKSRSELGDKRQNLSAGLRKARNEREPRPTDQTDSKLSIKMFAQPHLRRFLSRDKRYVVYVEKNSICETPMVRQLLDDRGTIDDPG